VEDIHAADHSRLVHQRKSINSPRYSTNLSIDLDEYLVDNGSQVLTLGDGVGKNCLTGNRTFRQEQPLDFIIDRRLVLLARN
jgi:hypothetical protein